jgi:hypothetical protein
VSSKSRRRITIAAGAAIAGAAIPIAAAFNAWADEEITYDGKIIYDNFPNAPAAGASDVGTAAESGANNDWAEVYGPASYASDVGLANDSAVGDSGDFALYQGTTAPSAFYGTEGALITNATNSNAEVYGGGNAIINDFAPQYGANPGLVTDSSALASNGGTALIGNDGLTSGLTTMTGDYASANGTANGTSTVGEILDSNYSTSIANDTGFNPTTFEGGSAVDVANYSFAYATNPGSAADIKGGEVNGDPLSGGPAISDSANTVTDGKVFDVITSNTYEFNGTPLFGAASTAAEATAAHGSSLADILPELFGSTTSSSVDSFSNLWADLAGLL